MLYYNDVSAALYMQEAHGVKYVDARGEEFKLWDICESGYHLINRGDDKWRISDDSLSILEPQEGDVCRFIGPGESYYYNKYDAFDTGRTKQTIQIIQRNSLSFIWPEEEE